MSAVFSVFWTMLQILGRVIAKLLAGDELPGSAFVNDLVLCDNATLPSDVLHAFECHANPHPAIYYSASRNAYTCKSCDASRRVEEHFM